MVMFFVFFFLNEKYSQVTHQGSPAESVQLVLTTEMRSRELGIPQPNARHRAFLQQRLCERFCRTAVRPESSHRRNHGAFTLHLEERWHRISTRLANPRRNWAVSSKPLASHLQNHQTGSSCFAYEFRVGPLHPSSSILQGSVDANCATCHRGNRQRSPPPGDCPTR